MADTGRCVVWSSQADRSQSAQKGSVCLYPCQELEEDLWEVIKEEGLEEDLAAAFQMTKPLWYGFWIESPLTRQQCFLLFRLLSGLSRQSRGYGGELRAFFTALKAAYEQNRPLHVFLPPPGHTDFGVLTIFAHCPRCKAEAPFQRWRDYPMEPIPCPVCNVDYSPAETYSSKEYDLEEETSETTGRESDGCLIALTIVWVIMRAFYDGLWNELDKYRWRR